MILIDTSGLLAALDADEPDHPGAVEALRSARGPRLLSPFVLAELDYLLTRRRGEMQALSLLAEVARGAYTLEPFASGDMRIAADLIRRHRGLGLGLSDASILVLALRTGARDVLTLDQRHFRAVAWPSGLRLLPADLSY